MPAIPVFKNHAGQYEDRKMSTFEEIFQDSWFYQEIWGKGRQLGFAEGFAKGLEQAREAMRQGIVDMVQARFPDMAEMAQQRLETVHDAEALGQLIVKIAIASTAEEARRLLLELPDGHA